MPSLESANEDRPVFLIYDSACEDMEGWLKQGIGKLTFRNYCDQALLLKLLPCSIQRTQLS